MAKPARALAHQLQQQARERNAKRARIDGDRAGRYSLDGPTDLLSAMKVSPRTRSIGGGEAPRTVRLAAAAAMALLMGSGATAAHAAPFGVPPGTPRVCVGLDVYRASSATRTLCHFVRTIPLSAITERPDGGHEYHYEVGGSPITISSPPAGFNAVTASQGEREAYGIPREPTVTETALPTLAGSSGIHHFTPVPRRRPSTSPCCRRRQRTVVLTSDLAPPGLAVEEGGGGALDKDDARRGRISGHWAGYVDTGELQGGITAPPFNAAGITYKEPQRLDDCEGTHASPWVGLGGYGSEPLDQAGTELGKGDGIAEHQAWIENLRGTGRGRRLRDSPAILRDPGRRLSGCGRPSAFITNIASIFGTSHATGLRTCHEELTQGLQGPQCGIHYGASGRIAVSLTSANGKWQKHRAQPAGRGRGTSNTMQKPSTQVAGVWRAHRASKLRRNPDSMSLGKATAKVTRVRLKIPRRL